MSEFLGCCIPTLIWIWEFLNFITDFFYHSHHSKAYCSISMCLYSFYDILVSISNLNYDPVTWRIIPKIFLYLLRVALWLKYGLFWRRFQKLLRKCTWLLANEIFYRCLRCPFRFKESLLSLCLDNLSFGGKAVLTSPSITVLGSVSIFNSSSICFM